VYRNEIAHSVPADTRAQAVTAADQLPSSVLQAAPLRAGSVVIQGVLCDVG
jgi:hypothetical protein